MDHPRGLFNLGSTCYLNSLIQGLLSCERFVKLLEAAELTTDATLAQVLQNLIRLLNDNKDTQGALMPADLVRACQAAFPFINITTQNDMHEMYTFVMDRLNQELKCDMPMLQAPLEQPKTLYDKLKSKCEKAWRQQIQKEYSPLREFMYGMSISQVKCSYCQHIHHNYQTFNVWEIPMSDSASFHDMFLASCQTETLTEWTCSECSQTLPSEKTTQIWSLPPVLVITIQRFQRHPSGHIVKHRGDVDIPEFISLQGLVDYKNDEKKNYQLKSIGMHQGDVNGGHYYSVCKRLDQWYVINDAAVSNSTKVSSSDVYMLFYELN